MTEQLSLGPNTPTPFIQTEEYVDNQKAAQVFADAQPALGQDEEGYGPTSHYATVEKGDSDKFEALRIPELASSVNISDVTKSTPEGIVIPVTLPNREGKLQPWFKTDVTTDAKGDRHVVLNGTSDRQDVRVTIPESEYKIARKAQIARNALADAALGGMPEPAPRQVALYHEPYEEPEIERRKRRKPRSQIAGNQNAEHVANQSAEIGELEAKLNDLRAKYSEKDGVNLHYYATNMLASREAGNDYTLANVRMSEANGYRSRLSEAAQQDADLFLDTWAKLKNIK